METLLICISSYNTFSRGAEVLERTIKGVSDSIKYLYNQKNDVKVLISWVDDASTDGTLNEVKRLRDLQDEDIKENFFINSIQVNKGQGYCRNLAVALYNSDYICPFDSDDEMYEEHLDACLKMMMLENKDGKKFALGATTIEISEKDILPYWIGVMNDSIPINKIIRREVWEFLEGMPTDFIYRRFGGEDSAFILTFDKFFTHVKNTKTTAKYWNYKGSNFDGQLEKFRSNPNEYIEDYTRVPREAAELKNRLINRKIEYLEQKLRIFALNDEFNHLITKFPHY